MLIERRPEFRNAGVAYHRAGNPWQHVFNIQAGRMSMFREDVDDFMNTAAMRKLNDLSVTPRDLGLSLGLGTRRNLEEA